MAKGKSREEEPGFSDEEWEEFQKSFDKDSTKTATYKEPSARQRELTAKWKNEPPKDTGWRTDGPRTDVTPPNTSKPANSPGGDPWGRPKRSPWKRNLTWAVVAALVTVGVILVPRAIKADSGTSDNGTKTNGTTAYVTPGASQQPPSAAPPAPTPVGDVFAGSPAESYANGADGIVLPQASAIGGYSADQVAAALAQSKRFLVAANLDPVVLMGASPDAVLGMIDPVDRARADLVAALKHPTYNTDPLTLVTRFAPKETKLAVPTVKVHGSIAPSIDKDGVLDVRADFLFVYGVEAADGTGEPTREVVRRVMTTRVLDPQHYEVTPGKLWISDYTDQVDNSPCGINDGFLHPYFPGVAADQPDATASPSPGTTPSPTGIALYDPFDQSKPVTSGTTIACTNTTRM